MAAGEYLKVAAAQLRRAAEFMHRESAKMQAEQTRLSLQKKMEISKHINKLKVDQVALSRQRASNNTDPIFERRLQMEARALEQQIAAKKNELQQINSQLSNAAQAKEQAAKSLTNRARDLEIQSSAPIFSS